MFLREIKFHLALNERVIEAFGRFQDEGKWDAREILVKPRRSSAKEATVTCVGVGGPVASRHYDLILADDLVDEENARTEGQREKVRTWYYKTLLPCLEPDGRLFIVGTRYHFLDLYGLLIKNELAASTRSSARSPRTARRRGRRSSPWSGWRSGAGRWAAPSSRPSTRTTWS